MGTGGRGHPACFSHRECTRRGSRCPVDHAAFVHVAPVYAAPPVHVAHAFDVSVSGVLGVMLENADKVANGYGLRPFDRGRGRSDFP